ncbi:MAG TPA: radical SAM protein [Sandaracinaceae bacterium LLY-WYZ-13_1]|nr:radical SAM protein [Sandaracinaceae bacterium LLY-WYZ-13_1]
MNAPVPTPGESSVTQVKTRACEGCGTEVRHRTSGCRALERVPCPSCGQDVLFSNYVRMDIALSEYCNLKCQMCRRPSETLFMDAERCKTAMTEAVRVGVEYLSFSGGEPFVHPQILELLEHAFSLGAKVQMVSNGTLIREKHLDLLSNLDCLTISIDGTEAAHDHIRRRPGTYQRSLKTLRLLTEKSDIQWGTNTVMQRDNHDCLYDSFRAIQAIGGYKYAYCGFSHVEVVPETVDLQMTPAQAAEAYRQIVAIEKACEETHTWFNDREMLLSHFGTYARKDRRYRPMDGCKIPQKFIGLSDHGFYLCWHQGRNIRGESLIEALETELAQDIVNEGLEKRCVACNCFNYSWDDEWNRGIMRSAEAGASVEEGVVPLRVPDRMRMVTGGSDGNTLDIHEI